ncbi:MAG: rod shape-determining protein MreD [Treponema sp.]|nr:rod shape-determining protein MreD [Treponema sp.]
MAKNVIWTVVFSFVAAVLQSTLLRRLALFRAVPDLALCIVVYSAYVNGVMTGQLSGFFSGILIDFISAAPLGLNPLIRTLAGALAGFMKGTFFLGAVFLPMVLCAAATLLKAAVLFVLHLLFGGAVPSYSLVSPLLWAELCLNTFLAPFLFFLLKRFMPLLSGQRTYDAAS